MPIIILEGIDGAGKSTLAEALKAASPLPAEIVHKGPMTQTVVEEYMRPLLDWPEDKLLIADRWHVGEMIYGPIYRGASLVEGDYNDTIEKILGVLNAVRVIVQPPLEVVIERMAARGEDYLKPQHVKKVYNFYKRYQKKHGYWLLEEWDEETVANLIIKSLSGVKIANYPAA